MSLAAFLLVALLSVCNGMEIEDDSARRINSSDYSHLPESHLYLCQIVERNDDEKSDFDSRISQKIFFSRNISKISLQSLREDVMDPECQYFSSHLNNIEEKWQKAKKISGAVIGAISGVMLTPIFLESYESLFRYIDVDLDTDKTASIVIRYLSMACLVSESISVNWCIASDNRKKEDGKYNWIGQCFLGAQSLIPVSLLWDIERSHQIYAESSGFDMYMTVFTIGALPLMLSSYFYSRQVTFGLSNETEDPLTQKEKIFAFGIPLLNSFARGVIGYALCSTAMERIFNEDETVAIALPSVILGGLCSNAMGLLQEINGCKQLVYTHRNNDQLTFKKILRNICILSFSSLKSLPLAVSVLKFDKVFEKYSKIFLASEFFLTHSMSSLGTSLGFIRNKNIASEKNI